MGELIGREIILTRTYIDPDAPSKLNLNYKYTYPQSVYAAIHQTMDETSPTLEDELEGVKNYQIAVKEKGEDIIFLRKIVKGGTDESYGIHVARLAGMPQDLLKRASEILNSYENNSSNKTKDNNIQLVMDFKSEDKTDLLREKLKEIDVLNLTPLDAINILYELKNIK